MALKGSPESFTFTVGKLDAGMAILLGERAHLIEFPSILLPPGATAGSIVNIAVHQNHAEERRRDAEFWQLQNDILREFGVKSPVPPDLKVRNVTQTSVTLEWPQIELASSKLRSLDIYRNNERLAAIPAPLTNTSTKVSGLQLNTDYTFQLVLRTTGGTYPSSLIHVRTHTISDTSGICVCFGNVQDELLLENAKMALREMKARWSDKIQIDTTHFVCTTPAATPNGAQAVGNTGSPPGIDYQRALQLSIPVVQPHWILACHAEKKMIPIASYYLGATPTTPASASYSSNRPQSMSYTQSHSPASTPLSGVSAKASPSTYRASMPAPTRTPPHNASAFVNQPFSTTSTVRPPFESTLEEGSGVEDPDVGEVKLERSTSVEVEEGLTTKEQKRKSRAGTMNREFKFPPASPPAPIPDLPSVKVEDTDANAGDKTANLSTEGEGEGKEEKKKISAVAPTSIEVPPPPPVEKERTRALSISEGEDDVGDTVDIPLN